MYPLNGSPTMQIRCLITDSISGQRILMMKRLSVSVGDGHLSGLAVIDTHCSGSDAPLSWVWGTGNLTCDNNP